MLRTIVVLVAVILSGCASPQPQPAPVEDERVEPRPARWEPITLTDGRPHGVAIAQDASGALVVLGAVGATPALRLWRNATLDPGNASEFRLPPDATDTEVLVAPARGGALHAFAYYELPPVSAPPVPLRDLDGRRAIIVHHESPDASKPNSWKREEIHNASAPSAMRAWAAGVSSEGPFLLVTYVSAAATLGLLERVGDEWRLAPIGGATGAPDAAVDGGGGVHVCHPTPSGVMHSHRVGGAWVASLVDEYAAGGCAIAAGDDATLHIAYDARTSRNDPAAPLIIRHATRDGDAWRTEDLPISLPGGPLGYTLPLLDIAVDAAGRPAIAYYHPDPSEPSAGVLQRTADGWPDIAPAGVKDVGTRLHLAPDRDRPTISAAWAGLQLWRWSASDSLPPPQPP